MYKTRVFVIALCNPFDLKTRLYSCYLKLHIEIVVMEVVLQSTKTRKAKFQCGKRNDQFRTFSAHRRRTLDCSPFAVAP